MDSSSLPASLSEWMPLRIALGKCGDRHFILMASAGLDASVIDAVEQGQVSSDALPQAGGQRSERNEDDAEPQNEDKGVQHQGMQRSPTPLTDSLEARSGNCRDGIPAPMEARKARRTTSAQRETRQEGVVAMTCRVLYCLTQSGASACMNCFVPSRPVSRNQSGPPSRSIRISMSKKGQQSRSPSTHSARS
jgi:hypothetical protein